MESASGSFEWALPKFLKLTGRQCSAKFVVGPYSWCLVCYPKGNPAGPGADAVVGHLSLYLDFVDAGVTPASLCPDASYSLTVKHCTDPGMNVTTNCEHVHTKEAPNWGMSKTLPLADITPGSGYLSKDGTLTVRVDFSAVRAKEKRLTRKPAMLGSVGGDLLALLDEPGDTADFTIVAGGRSFRVHRCIVAARCSYFKTLFATAFADSSAKELQLEDADPGALDLLLRYLYGGALDDCAREVLKAAATLADRLLLPDVHSTLLHRLLSTTTHETVVEDMLWAEQRDDKPLLSDLEQEYLDLVGSIRDESVELLAQRSPQLLVRLHKAVVGSSKRQGSG